MAKSFNTDAKVLIRNKWDKPLLNLLERKTGNKLVYLGLPSPEAEDIEAWIEHLKIVIAFQCRKYGIQSDVLQEREDVMRLHEKLLAYERQMQLENFIVYDGYIEEVVLRGYDNSPDTVIPFELKDIVTVYNLDFCNNITSPIEFLDKGGNIQKAYKFNAVKELLQIQHKLAPVSSKFVLFLTVHSSYKGGELDDFINPTKQSDAQIKELLNKYKALPKEEQNQKIVQLFVIHTLKSFFRVYNLVPHFLPTIYYKGLGDQGLLHFSVIGTVSESCAGGETIWYQDVANLCAEKRITIENDEFSIISCEDIEHIDIKTQPVEHFCQSRTYSQLWQ
ncbi:hypothetical protein M2451_002681 [Dysgonomonas sp. PFB1-18]|uniref:hypothetical protein n=1 Tax=unclassified Dysgonomonas TaxID=2630389 RepID=UPI002475FF9C|nr:MULTISPECIES: hypothetical protein [unclassified Dysgonomonas]MDH6309433.1 hypothetical protein [Dysgonomonas sp. PF1-14]MDH6339702.1 hypothetical protein [Dysgonomonas sp. PF1-16]MDH6381350.1 hypothetical protein [Dysgonomonas sp. PFB1-18]MDH6398565.1 hypothetical protein [Dysgonomonas sp. PF1-23]